MVYPYCGGWTSGNQFRDLSLGRSEPAPRTGPTPPIKVLTMFVTRTPLRPQDASLICFDDRFAPVTVKRRRMTSIFCDSTSPTTRRLVRRQSSSGTHANSVFRCRRERPAPAPLFHNGLTCSINGYGSVEKDIPQCQKPMNIRPAYYLGVPLTPARPKNPPQPSTTATAMVSVGACRRGRPAALPENVHTPP